MMAFTSYYKKTGRLAYSNILLILRGVARGLAYVHLNDNTVGSIGMDSILVECNDKVWRLFKLLCSKVTYRYV